MAVAFTGADVRALSVGGTSLLPTVTTSFAVGDILVALVAWDNSGGGGADPVSGTLSISAATGAFGASVSAQSGLNDPGAASAGLAVRCVAWPVTTAIPSGTGLTISWTGSAVTRTCALMKVSSSLAGGGVSYRTNSGATGTNSVNVANATAFVTPSVNSGEGVLCWTAEENGVAITGDTDTTNGTWSAVYGTFQGTGVAGMATYFQSKVVTATGTQTFNPTGNATLSDWITGCLIFTEILPPPSITQAAYQFFDDAGTESGAASLAAVNTPINGDITNGDGIGALRIRLQNTTAFPGISTDDYRLQWEKNASGSWVNVPSTLVDGWVDTGTGNSSCSVGEHQAQSFLGDGRALKSVRVRMRAGVADAGVVSAVLYAHSGTFGTSSVGTGAALATSTTSVAHTSIATTNPGTWVTLDFDGSFTLVNGTPYVIAVQTTVSSVFVYVSSAGTAPGNKAVFTSGAWSSQSTTDLNFGVYAVEASSVVGYDNPNLTGTGATTNRLGAGTGSFQAGEISEDGHVDDLALNASAYTEILYSLKIIAADVVAGDTLRFRVLCNGATTQMTYTQVPTINIVRGTANIAASISTNWDSWDAQAAGVAETPTGTNWPATIADNWGTWDAQAFGSVSHFYPPWGVPENVIAQNTGSSTQLQISWHIVSDALGYDLERDGVIILTDHPFPVYVDTGLSPNTTYNYRVRAVG